MKKKLLVFAVLATVLVGMLAIVSSADEVIDGIAYSFSGSSASVTSANQTCELETIVIPETVTTSDNKTYTVTTIKSGAFQNNTNVKYVSLPATLTKIESQAFRKCTNLLYVEFNGNQNELSFSNFGHFMDCSSLKAIAFPDNVTTIQNRSLTDCTSLEAVYLPAKVVKMGSNGSGFGPFCGNKKMYFVQESFSFAACFIKGENGIWSFDESKLPTLPKKPSVYYMPSTLTTLIGHVRKEYGGNGGTEIGSYFGECESINETIVFGENFKYIPSRNIFESMGSESSPKTVVFLGDIEGAVTLTKAKYVSIVFANELDKSPADIGLVAVYKNEGNEGSYMYFCYDGMKYNYSTESSEIDTSSETYLANLAAYVEKIIAAKTNEAKHVAKPGAGSVTPADCINNAKTVEKCFCGADMDETEIDGSALGHNHDLANGATLIDITYTKFDETGYKTIKCSRCDVTDENTAADPILYGYQGFSVPENASYKGITFGYNINNIALDEYETIKDSELEMGFVVAVDAYLGENKPLDDGVTAKIIKAKFTDGQSKYNKADFVLKGDIWDTTVVINNEEVLVSEVEFFMSAYVIENGTVNYVNEIITSYAQANTARENN